MVDYYVKISGDDTKDGLSWTNAWATVNKAATTVADGSTVHIGFGTYNNEPDGNKIAPANIGSTGIEYLPETETTGGGTGSVIIERNPTVYGGAACTVRGATANVSWTVIQLTNPVNVGGTLDGFCYYAGATNGTIKIKVFRDDGTNFNFIGESDTFNIQAGRHSHPCNISVLAGDLIGAYITGNPLFAIDDTAGNAYYKSSDVTTNSLKSSWTTTPFNVWSFGAHSST